MNQEVTDYIAKLNEKPNQEWQVEVCESLRQMIHKTIPDVEERIQYGRPHYLKDGSYACVIANSKDRVSFMIFNATSLEAPDGFFAPGPPERKTAKFKKDETIDYGLLAKFLHQAANS